MHLAHVRVYIVIPSRLQYRQSAPDAGAGDSDAVETMRTLTASGGWYSSTGTKGSSAVDTDTSPRHPA
ncbi:unnamed protein product [Colias eurytheme]|nr:unnamed protein product [Colias eurytheme]